jgi:hypothetical protein
MLQVKGPKAFADMRRDVERKIANHAFTEEVARKCTWRSPARKLLRIATAMRIVREALPGPNLTARNNLDSAYASPRWTTTSYQTPPFRQHSQFRHMSSGCKAPEKG